MFYTLEIIGLFKMLQTINVLAFFHVYDEP